MTRLRYKELEGGLLINKHPLFLGTELVSVVINMKTLQYEIRNTLTQQVIASDMADTVAKLKVYARASLLNLGVKIHTEHRKGTKVSNKEIQERSRANATT